jgi:hypothetical protein
MELLRNAQGGRLATLNAMGDADAVIGIAGQRQTRQVIDDSLDPGDAFQVPQLILRHDPPAALNFEKQRLSLRA